MQCSDVEQVLFTEFKLEGYARIWKEEFKRRDEIIWADFMTEL